MLGDMACLLLIMGTNKQPWKTGEFGTQRAEALVAYMESMQKDPAEYLQHHDLVCWDRGIDADCSDAVEVEIGIGSWWDASTFRCTYGDAPHLNRCIDCVCNGFESVPL